MQPTSGFVRALSIRVGALRPRIAALTAAVLAASVLSTAAPEAAGAPGPDQTRTIESFDGQVPFETDSTKPGILTWGSDADDRPTLSAEPKARDGAGAGNKVLHAEYDISGWGGFSHHLSFNSDPQDWSAFRGIRFWWYGQNTAPLPPGSGPTVRFEVKDGGADAEHSELWTTSFTDDWQGWHLVEIPFGDLVYRTDYQPAGGIDHVLGLDKMWGYAVTLPAGKAGRMDLDQVELYGVADPGRTVRVVTDKPVYPVDEGGAATVKVSAVTVGGAPLAEPVTVDYRTGQGTASAGQDYRAASGSFTFPAGTASGAQHAFRVRTLRDGRPEVAETIPLTLTVQGAGVGDDPPEVVVNAHGLPYLNKRLPVDRRVRDLVSRMTLDEKIGQMTQAERGALVRPDDIATDALGSLLSGGGSAPNPNTPTAWADMVDGYQLRTRETRLQIPLIYGADAVHGHNNVVGATLFPHNEGLGASRDPDLVERAAHVTATEERATGIPWDFAPCLCVTRDERWGRSYESYGEDPALVSTLATAVTGFQGGPGGEHLKDNDRVLATAKHFVGDGGTAYGSSTTGSYTIDQGVTKVTRQELEAVHLAPFQAAVDKGVGTVMPSYSSVDYLGDDAGPLKMHANGELITGVLKQKLGFQGFVISDWQAIDQIPGDYASDVRTSINAGLDMIMVPSAYQTFEQTLKAEAGSGNVPVSRIDDAVRRILRQKFALGLFEKPYADRTHLAELGSAEHRAVAREAAAKSQVLLRNDGGLLPLSGREKLYVAGSNADDLGNQAGGWTISWQGSSGNPTEGTTILQGIRDVAPGAQVTYSKDASAPTDGFGTGLVVVGETPYAEGVGDVGNGSGGNNDLVLSPADRSAIDKVCGAMHCVVLVVSGRPQLLADQLGQIDALVASWLPGTEGAGVADALFGKRPYTGRLPVSWPRSEAQIPVNVGDADYDPLFPYGWGLATGDGKGRLRGARDALDRLSHHDGRLRAAVAQLDQVLRSGIWSAAASEREKGRALAALGRAAAALADGTRDTFAQDDAVVSAARAIAQAAVVSGGADAQRATAKLTAGADHALLSGHPDTAVRLLQRAYRSAVGG